MIQTETVRYFHDKTPLQGFLAYDNTRQGPLPAVLIASDWKGLGDPAKDKAEILAKYGYLAFAADIYGEGKQAVDENEAAELMQPLFTNRKLLRERILAAHKEVSRIRLADPRRIAAIGFCFGGLTVIELLRSGAHLRGIVSFHGIYGDALGGMEAKTAPKSTKLHGSALLLQGYEDPLLPPADIAKFQKEMNDSGVDWQMHTFGHTAHAFTNPMAANHEKGLVFNARSSIRAWQMMHLFLEEIFV